MLISHFNSTAIPHHEFVRVRQGRTTAPSTSSSGSTKFCTRSRSSVSSSRDAHESSSGMHFVDIQKGFR